jgi:hypothetical protein
MTIEAKIDALIESLNANTAALRGTTTAPAAGAPKPAPSQPAKPPAAAAGAKVAAPAGKTPTYDDVKAAGMALAKKKPGKPLHEVLATFSVDHANKLKPEQYAAFINAANAKAAE